MAPGIASAPDPQLQLEPPGVRVYLLLSLLAVVLPTLVAAAVPWSAGDLPEPVARLAGDSRPLARLLGAGGVLSLALAAYAGLVLLMRRHRLRMDAGGVELATTFYTRRLRWEQLRLDAARVVDIAERTELRPLLKTNGASMPGFHSGWFRSRSFTRLFVATVGGRRLLWVPTRQGYDLLLQPRKPAAVLARMQALAAASAVAPGQRPR